MKLGQLRVAMLMMVFKSHERASILNKFIIYKSTCALYMYLLLHICKVPLIMIVICLILQIVYIHDDATYKRCAAHFLNAQACAALESTLRCTASMSVIIFIFFLALCERFKQNIYNALIYIIDIAAWRS